MRLLLVSTAIISVALASQPARAATVACPYYGGHVDIEGKIGSKRDIGEVSVFLPVACSQDSLLFADLRLKRDNTDNKEGNWGLGFRHAYETGIWGNYFYLDRKVSGITDKYHTQLTFGSEWLAEVWEVRANAYVPVTGAKSVTASGALSGINLSGNTIFVSQSAGTRLTEESLYGGDIEAGFKVPDTKFWLHAGAFSFHGDDVKPVNGARIRARLDLTENVSLNAEGQYDGARGRQGWLGVRFTMPFGGPEKKPEGLAARMTASPVRDVDIVTQSRQEKIGQDRTITVMNNQSGNAQRVLYVDNTFSGVGDGTKEAPFSTLADAQPHLNANDIVYVYHGDGSTSGMDAGFQINQDGVMLIGSGSNLVYDPDRFSLSDIGSIGSVVLIPKTQAPTITNGAQWVPVISVTGRDATIAGINVTGADSAAGIQATATNANLGTITVRDVNSSNNDGFGLNIYAAANGRFDKVILQNVTTNANHHNGTRVSAEGGTIGKVEITDLVSNNNTGANATGLNIAGYADAEIEEVIVRNVTTSNNETQGFTMSVHGGVNPSIIHAATIDNLTAEGNLFEGIYIGAGNAQGEIVSLRIQNSTIRDNGRHGIHFETYGGASANNILRNTVVSGNQWHGVRVYKDGSDTHTIDLGTLADYGMNTLSGNGLSNPATYGDLGSDIWAAGYTLSVVGNWWGSTTGPDASQIKGNAGVVNATPYLTAAP